MSKNVFANGREVSAKKDGNQTIAAMPDVCLSPPSPPAGPIPIPYPNTAKSSDTADGSSSVKMDGNPIMLQDKKYEKGLSMYAGADLEYNLAGKYKEFKAILGVDSRIAEEGQGKVTVSIYCDKQKVLTKEVSTQAAVPIAINVKDVGTLRIVVSGANFTNYSGHATLANAHVSQ